MRTWGYIWTLMKEYFITIKGLWKGPPLCPPAAINLDVEDLRREKWTREIRAGTFYHIMLRWFVNKMQSDGLDVRRRRKRGHDLGLIRHYPAFEVTSLCTFPRWPTGTRAASSLARIKQEPRHMQLWCPLHAGQQTEHLHTYTHTHHRYPYQTTLRHGKHYGF